MLQSRITGSRWVEPPPFVAPGRIGRRVYIKERQGLPPVAIYIRYVNGYVSCLAKVILYDIHTHHVDC